MASTKRKNSIPLADTGIDWSNPVGEPVVSRPAPEPEQEQPSGMIRRTLGDTGVSLVKSAISVPETFVGMADMVTGGHAGKLVEDMGVRFKDANSALDELYSPEYQAASKKVQQADGVVDTLKAAFENPSTIYHGAVTSMGSMLTGAPIGRAATALRAPGWLAGGLAEGASAAGQNLEQVRQESKDGLVTGEQAAIIGASGLLTAGITSVAGRIANKLGIGDINQMIAGAERAGPEVQKGLARKLLEGFATEGVLQEFPQSYQEQVAQNIATGKPWDQGASNAGVMGGLSGGLLGAGAAPFGNGAAPVVDPAANPALLPDTGPMSRAANAATIAARGQPLDFTPTEIPAKGDGLAVKDKPDTTALDFEADPRFAGSIAFPNGKAPAQPLFANKQMADVHIGELGAFNELEPVEAGNGQWTLQQTPEAANRNARANIEQWMSQAQPMEEAQAKDMAKRAESELNKPMTALPMPDGDGWTVVPRQWVSAPVLLDYTERAAAAAQARGEQEADMQAAGEARAARVQEAANAPVDRAPRTPRADAVEIDPAAPNAVAQFIAQQATVNTPAARAFVQEYRAGRVTDADVLARITPRTNTEPSADERLAAAAKAGKVESDSTPKGLILNREGKPFKTEMAATRESKKHAGSQVVPAEGGYAVQPAATTDAKDTAAPATAGPQADQEAVDPAGAGVAEATGAGEQAGSGAAVEADGVAGKQEFQIGGRDPHTIAFEHRADGRLVRTITYPDGQRTTETLVTDKKGDEHWVSNDRYGKGEFYPRQLSQDEAAAAIKEDLSGKDVGSGGKATSKAPAETAIQRRNRLKAERATPVADTTKAPVEQPDTPPAAPQGNADKPGPAKPEAAPAEVDPLDAELQDALGKLGDVLGDVFGAKLNITGPQYGAADLLPALSKVVELLVRKGFKSFAQATTKAAQVMRANAATAAHVDTISARQWKAAYNAIADAHEGTDSEDVLGALTVNDVKALVASKTAETLNQKLIADIAAGNMPKDNPALRKLVQEFDGAAPDQARMKVAQETLEAAIVQTAREVVSNNKGEGDKTTFTILNRLYDSQPNLNIRTSTSIDNQAYSTPAPLAYLGARLADITPKTTVYEPTGGNGMLTITAKPGNVTATELDTQRAESLKAQGINVTQGDALKAEMPAKSKDRVITNPPFGPIKNDQGESIKVKFDGYTLGQIDHLIAARALEAMKDDGKATLIIGANKVAGQQSNNDLIFFNWLYGHYNVTSHFEVDGDLYHRQGADWPVRVITIQGRSKSTMTAPSPTTIQRAKTWSEVYERFQQGMDAGRSAGSTGKGTVGSESRQGDDAKPVSGTAAAEAGRDDSSRPEGGTAGDANVGGERAGSVVDSTAAPDAGVGERSDAVGSNDQAPGSVEDAGFAVSEAAAKSAGNPRTAGVTSTDPDNQFQTKYIARSDRKDEGVLIPVNMAGPTQDALNRLEDEVGDIDQFAAKELGYKSVAELHRALMGLQVDSVASAISQIKAGKGVIVADQTGIGKGRQAAAVIRWAVKNGKVPIFITVKPSLFTDMFGDLHDIGTDDIQPFLMNSGESIKGEGDERLFANQPGLHKRVLEGIASSGELPSGRNALFMTYSQINVDNIQRRAVMALAPNAVFVLDESHNAGGASATGDFIKGALDLASGVTYLSATYAKRPDNMPVYFKTDIGDAVADDNTLMAAMSAGGLPLQTVVSNNLVKAGQMFRRERSYDGVSIESRADTEHKAQHVALSDETTLALRAIVSADRTFHHSYVKSLQKELEKQGSRLLDMAGNQAQQSVDHTQFSSVVHNFVRQMLLGLKAQEAASDAIRSIKRGEKPLIAVEGTMGSFLAEYAENNGVKAGDSLGSFDYRTVLSRALERSRYVVRQMPNGDKVKEYVPMSKLDPLSFEAYQKAQRIIDGLKIDIPVSPIDWMRDQITKAGYSVAEITGRNLSVDYSDPKNPKLSQIDQREQKDKVRTTRQFNDGSLDAIILNVAGSTGISLHASEKFKDQRQRHMIVAQAAQDINIFMQMLGRIHRTGQVRLPKYTLLSADLPAEIRPTALLSGKMKSLNANTSSNTESATSVKSADMLNKYGDQIVQQYLADNHELAQALDLEAGDVDADKGGQDDIARKATGRLALMPVKVQEQFYAEVEEQYQALIDYLNKTNQNDLEPRTFDFDAQEIKSSVLFEGQNKASPFGEDALYGEYSVKAQGKAMTPDEIKAATAEHLGGKSAEEHIKALAEPLQAAFTKMAEGIADEAQKAKAGDVARAGSQFLYAHKIGDMFRVEINGEHYNAIVTNIRSTHKASGNPFSLSKIQVTIALNGALRSVTLPATQFGKIESSRITGGYGSSIEAAFKVGAANERETAKIVTGNLLGAYGEIEGVRGSIITFSKADGTTEQGILLPKAFNFTKDVRQDYRLKTGADALNFLTVSKNENIDRFGINSRDQVVRVLPSGLGGITIQVPKSKAKGGKYFLDKALREAAGDFVSSGNFMRATITGEERATKALNVLMQKGALYALPSMAEEARQILGDTGSTDTPAFSRSNAAVQERRAERPSSERTKAVEALAAQITARWKNAPEVVVVESLDDRRVPKAVRDEGKTQQSQGAQGDPEGFFHGGKVYLVAPQLGGDADVVRVLFHEALGHFGLRGTFGPELGTILDRLAVLNAGKVRAKAKQYGLDYDKTSDRRIAAEEVLAEMAQRSPDIGWAKKAVAAIRTWLRQHVPGFGKMAFSDDEIVRSFILPARAFVQRGRGSIGGAVAFSRSDADLTRPSISEPPQAGSVEDERRWVRETSAALRRYADALTGKENPVYPGKVEHSGSAAGPSSYFKLGAQEVRVSLHSKGAFNSQFYLPVFDAESAGRVLDHIERGAAEFAQKKAEGRNVYFSRSTIGDAVTNFSQAGARNAFLDAVTTHGSTNLWGRTVGTQYHKAQTHPKTFGRVFDAVQDYIKDTSVFANRAADLAPSLLPKLDTLADLKKDGLLRHGADPKDTAKAGEAIFQGTLNKELYDDATLRSEFGLNAKQIGLYREFRAAVDQSLDGLGKTEILRIAGEAGRAMREDVLAAASISEAGDILTEHMEGDDAAIEQISEKVARIKQLQAEGYAPLTRFGKHTLHVTGPDGNTEFFGMYETVRDANRAARQLRGDPAMADMTFTQGVMSQEGHKLFNGLSMDSLELFADATGNTDNPVYQAYLKLAIANRSALKRMIERKGIAGYSDDVARVLASFVTSNARMSAGHLHLADAKKSAEAIPKEQGDLRDDAIKLVDYVTNPAEEAAAVRGLLFTSFIGGSVASALVNMTQPITMTLPYLTQHGGAIKAGKRLTAAMAMVASGKGMDAKLTAALKRAEADGIVSPQEIHHLQAAAMNTLGQNPLLKKAAFVWGSMFALAEQFNRRVSFVAAYHTAQQEGIDNPFAFAEKAVIETQGLYNKGNKANAARGAVGATVMTFKQFSTHYLEFLVRMWKSGPEGKKAVAVALALLILMGGAGGLPFADDLDDLIDTLGQAMGHDTNSKRWKRQFVSKTLGLGDEAADVATRGLTALPGFPLDLSLRMGMGNLLPATGLFLRSNTDTARQLLEVAGAAGGLAANVKDGVGKLLAGDLGGAAMAPMPTAVQNMAKAIQMAQTGEYRNSKGAKVMNVDATDAAMKFIGFQPAEVARESGRVGETMRSIQLAKNVESEIAGRWAQAMVDGDADGVAKAKSSLADWNADNPSTPIKITLTQVLARVKALKSSRAQRTLKSAPKEMRGTVRESMS